MQILFADGENNGSKNRAVNLITKSGNVRRSPIQKFSSGSNPRSVASVPRNPPNAFVVYLIAICCNIALLFCYHATLLPRDLNWWSFGLIPH